MWMQTVNKADTERVWVTITNGQAATVTTHWGVFKFSALSNASSVSTNEGGTRGNGQLAGTSALLIGLAYEDIASGQTGAVQVYGYHESFHVTHFVNSVTISAGFAIGPCDVAASVGFGRNGHVDGYGPIVALDTVAMAVLNNGATTNYGNHCFIRCL